MGYREEHMLAEQLVYGCNKIVFDMYNLPQPLRVFRKKDGSKVTPLDQGVSDYVVEQAGLHGKKVLSEEAGSTAEHGHNGIFVLDPVDGTDDVIEGQRRPGRISIAAPSLGYWDERPVVGVVSFPLLGADIPPVTYSARYGCGATRMHRGALTVLQVDNRLTKGIVLMTVKSNDRAMQLAARLRASGYLPLAVDGAVYKACVLIDPFLRQFYPDSPELNSSKLPVVGFVSWGVHLHDVAATTCIIREAGGVVTTPKNQAGKQVWAAANNSRVYKDLLSLVAA